MVGAAETCAAGWPVADTMTLRWREARVGRGRLRLAQRVRADVSPEKVPAILEGVADAAHGGEIHVEWGDGSGAYLHRDVLRAWAEGRRADLPEMPSAGWRSDLEDAASRAGAIDGMRDAVRRLLGCGVVDGDWADDAVRRLHTAIQSLPVSSAPVWRS